MVQKKRFFWIITALLFCFVYIPTQADEVTDTRLRTERFSLLLDDDTYGSVLVRHGGGMFEIVHPDEILEQLPSTKAPKIFRALFSGLIEGSRVDYGVGSIVYNPKFKYITINIHSSFLLEDNRISPNNLQTETAMPSLSSWRTATITKEESQRESTVDVYFNQQLKGQLILRLSKHWFQVVDPTYLLSLLPRLKRQSEFISFFSGKIFDEKSIEGFASISLDTSTNQLEIEIADAFQFTQTQATEESTHELQPQYHTSRASDAFPKASSSSLLDDKPSSESVNSEEASASKESGLASIQIHKLEEFESEPTAVENEYEPESMLFDLYLADTQRGTILVNFTENWFEVPNPNDLVEQLSETKDKQAIVELVSGRIHKKRSIENIGSVHYDLDTFQIILNIDPSLLTGHSLVLDDTLPNPERKFSLQQSVHYAAAGELDTAMDMALTHKTIASLSKYWLNANGTYVQNDDYEFTEFSANGIVDDFETNIGLLRTDGQLLTSSNDFVGLSVQTSENIITNQSLLRGSKLEVFVPSHARVDFFRGGRLLSSQVLDYGLQEINTVAFPQGSYDVDIVITEDDGSVSRESRFFTKSGLLSLRSYPIYFAQGGMFRNQLDVQSIPIFEVGSRWRATDILQLNTSLSGTDESQIFTAESLAVWRAVVLGAGALYSSDEDAAVDIMAAGSLFDVYLDIHATHSFSGFDFAEPPVETVDDMLESGEIEPILLPLSSTTNQSDVPVLLTANKSTLSASLSRKFGDLSFRLSANRAITGEETRFAYGSVLNWNLYQKRDMNVRLDASYFNTQNGDEAQVGLAFLWRLDDWSTSSSGSYRSQAESQQASLTNTIAYNKQDTLGKQTRFQLSDNVQRKTTNAGDEKQGDTLVTNLVELEHFNDILRSEVSVRDSRSSGTKSTSAGLNAETAFVMSHTGDVSVTRPQLDGSLVIVEIDSDTTDSIFDILVNGRPYSSMKAGTSKVIKLSPYHTYSLSISPTTDADLVHYDTSTYVTTLFPGNIAKYSWKASRLFIALGRLIDEKGVPIPWQRIKGLAEYTVTEEDGTFQAEITYDKREELTIESEQYHCRIELPDSEKVEYFLELGDVICHNF